MRQVLVFLLLGCWALAMAQTPPAADTAARAEEPAPAVPCVPAADADSPDAAEGEGKASEDCDDAVPQTVPEENPLAADLPDEMDTDPLEIEGVIEENNLPTEASPDEEFKPGDEISEDFPVPLPSDI